MNNIFLVGYPGVGKSTLGSKAAFLAGFGFLDTDDWIEKVVGKSIAEIFDEFSEDGFRQLEQESLQSFKNLKNHVVSTGGGFINSKSFEQMKKIGKIVFLNAPVDFILKRMANNIGELERRPLFSHVVKIEEYGQRVDEIKRVFDNIMAVRQPIFEAADARLDMMHGPVDFHAYLLKNLIFDLSLSDSEKQTNAMPN